MDELKNDSSTMTESKQLIDSATKASKRMNEFMKCARHHIDSREPLCTDNTMTDLDDEIKNVASIIAYKAKIAEINLVINSTEKLTLQAHPMRIHQILLNLLGNALEANPETITLTVEKSGSFAKISIMDNGSGIPKDQLDRLFTKPETTKICGTGIGLTCVYEIVKDELSGAIEVTSTVGVGTTFILYLPLSL